MFDLAITAKIYKTEQMLTSLMIILRSNREEYKTTDGSSCLCLCTFCECGNAQFKSTADQKACFDCIDTVIQSVFIFIYILKQKPVNLEQPRAMRSIMILLLYPSTPLLSLQIFEFKQHLTKLTALSRSFFTFLISSRSLMHSSKSFLFCRRKIAPSSDWLSRPFVVFLDYTRSFFFLNLVYFLNVLN